MSEKSLRGQLETLMPLLADDEMELDAFVEKVSPSFEIMNSNAEHDRSSFIKKYKADQKKDDDDDDDQKRNNGDNDDEATKALKQQIEELQKRLDDADKVKKVADIQQNFISKVKEKGVKDAEWVKDYVSELTIGEEFDIDARVDACVKLYNKTKASTGNQDTNPGGAGGDGDGNDKYNENTIVAAGDIAKNRRLA